MLAFGLVLAAVGAAVWGFGFFGGIDVFVAVPPPAPGVPGLPRMPSQVVNLERMAWALRLTATGAGLFSAGCAIAAAGYVLAQLRATRAEPSPPVGAAPRLRVDPVLAGLSGDVAAWRKVLAQVEALGMNAWVHEGKLYAEFPTGPRNVFATPEEARRYLGI